MNRVGIVLAGRYELLELLGSGGMADVYKASDRKLNRYVAIKILRHEYSSDESFISRFQQEAMAAASIQNPCVVNVYDVGAENDINYIVMELAEGITLKEYIQKKGKLEIVEAINIAMQIVTGIREAHAHGIIHRDIKPQNVMVLPDKRAKVMDFGIAKAVTAQTITANTVGSVHYISPEQARGSACDERCDIYSIGITMYEMITGRVPFTGDSTVAIALAHIKEPITPPSVYEPMIPVSLEKIIMKCTQKKPEQRYASADELIDDLKKALMTPDEDFVKEVVIPQEGGTHIFSENDVRKIKEEANKEAVSIKSQEEEDYQLGLEDDDLEDEPADEEEADGKMEKVVLFIGVGVLLVVLLIAGLLIGRAFNLFSRHNHTPDPGTETSGTLSDDEVLMPAVIGLKEEDAKKRITDSDLKWKVEQQSSSSVEKGLVISASEEEGAVVKRQSLIILYISSGKNTVRIPDNIVNISEAAAIRALRGAGLEAHSIVGTPEDVVKEGYVYKCDPGVGEDVPEGETVDIYVSNGKIIVPDIRGMDENEAYNILTNEKGLIGDPSYEYSTRPEGTVISQEQVEAEVKLKTVIRYVVSKGMEPTEEPTAATVSVPGVTNLTLDDAKAKLKSQNLKVGNVTEEYSDSVEEGKVIRQSIQSGIRVDENTEVDLVVSLGAKEVLSKVPNLLGMSEEDALAKLEENNLKGTKLGEEASSAPQGQVIRMDHDAGEEVQPGTTIGYYVSAGEEDNHADD